MDGFVPSYLMHSFSTRPLIHPFRKGMRLRLDCDLDQNRNKKQSISFKKKKKNWF